MPSSIPQTQTQKALSKRTPGVGDFLKVPEQPLNSSFKSRVVDREKKPHRFQAEASKENVIGDKLKKGDGVKGEKGTKVTQLASAPNPDVLTHRRLESFRYPQHLP